jgi:hypothetical protein
MRHLQKINKLGTIAEDSKESKLLFIFNQNNYFLDKKNRIDLAEPLLQEK